MSNDSVSNAFDKLKQSAQQRLNSSRNGKTRVVVQVAHCSQAVGATEVAEAVSESLPQDAYMIVAGCDGACFDAPHVIVTYPNGRQRRFVKDAARELRLRADR